MSTTRSALTEEDIRTLVKGVTADERRGGRGRQLAIGPRPMLASTVTDAIAEHGSERAVIAACANDNADFAENALQQVIARFETHDRVLSAVAYRRVLPLSVTEKL